MALTVRILCDHTSNSTLHKCGRALMDFHDDSPPTLRGTARATTARLLVECDRCHKEYAWEKVAIEDLASWRPDEKVRVPASTVNA